MYTIKEEPDFFRDEAVKEKAKIMVLVLTHKKQTLGDYYFDSDNKLILFSNDSIDGYSKGRSKDEYRTNRSHY